MERDVGGARKQVETAGKREIKRENKRKNGD